MTVAPRASWYSGSGSRSARVCSHRSLATVSQRIRVSRSRTRAAFAVGATPSTGRSWVWRSATARSSIVVLPAPAGPTTTTRRSWPAIARAASVWHTSNPATFTVVDGVGEPSWASVAHTTIRSSSVRICSVVRCGASGSTHTDRPSPRPRRCRCGGVGVEVDAVFEDPVAGPFQRLRPTLSRHLRHGRDEIADRAHHLRPGPRRPCGRQHIHHLLHRRLGLRGGLGSAGGRAAGR